MVHGLVKLLSACLRLGNLPNSTSIIFPGVVKYVRMGDGVSNSHNLGDLVKAMRTFLANDFVFRFFKESRTRRQSYLLRMKLHTWVNSGLRHCTGRS